ncbi:MAG: ROK family protein [Candidatus Omnitrophica bacterium]|nr:ROK family protein [Candidatus Omnitrophota bacterium]
MLTFTKTPETDKEVKNMVIYTLLKNRGKMSRSDIANITKINMVSISNYVKSFIKKGLISEKQTGESSGGRPPILVDLNKDNVYAIGMHLTDSSVIGVLVNSTVGVVNKLSKDPASGELAEVVSEAVDSLKSGIDSSLLKGVAIVSSLSGNVDSVSLETKIEEKLSPRTGEAKLYMAPVSLACAYAEISRESNFPSDKIIYSFRDVGECVLWENFGFYNWQDHDQDEEGLSYLKPWDDIMGIRQRAKLIIEKGVGTEILHLAGGELKDIREIDVINAANKNDDVAIEILEFVGMSLGVRLAFLVNVFKPKKLILGGGVEKAGRFFIDPLRNSIEKLSMQAAFKKLEVKSASLGEEAAAVGSAALVIREIFMEG